MTSRTTIRLDSDLARRAKRRATQRKITFTQLVEEAIRQHLARTRAPAPSAHTPLPAFGDPNKKVKWEDLQRAIEQQQFEDDMRSLGLDPDAAA